MTKFSNKLFLAHLGPFSQFWGKKKFPENMALSRTTSYEFLAPCQISEKTNDKKVQGIIRKTFCDCFSSKKQCLRFILNCFMWEIKGFYQSSLGNEVDFRDIMNISPHILAKN